MTLEVLGPDGSHQVPMTMIVLSTEEQAKLNRSGFLGTDPINPGDDLTALMVSDEPAAMAKTIATMLEKRHGFPVLIKQDMT